MYVNLRIEKSIMEMIPYKRRVMRLEAKLEGYLKRYLTQEERERLLRDEIEIKPINFIVCDC